ncbi:hypothetical protein MMC31_000394 [Peltigera leucophlebia]|nr:hypothetical protein [Peltigera leucophlebia]
MEQWLHASELADDRSNERLMYASVQTRKWAMSMKMKFATLGQNHHEDKQDILGSKDYLQDLVLLDRIAGQPDLPSGCTPANAKGIPRHSSASRQKLGLSQLE